MARREPRRSGCSAGVGLLTIAGVEAGPSQALIAKLAEDYAAVGAVDWTLRGRVVHECDLVINGHPIGDVD